MGSIKGVSPISDLEPIKLGFFTTIKNPVSGYCCIWVLLVAHSDYKSSKIGAVEVYKVRGLKLAFTESNAAFSEADKH